MTGIHQPEHERIRVLKDVVVEQSIQLHGLRHAREQRDAIGTELRAANGRIRDLERDMAALRHDLAEAERERDGYRDQVRRFEEQGYHALVNPPTEEKHDG